MKFALAAATVLAAGVAASPSAATLAPAKRASGITPVTIKGNGSYRSSGVASGGTDTLQLSSLATSASTSVASTTSPAVPPNPRTPSLTPKAASAMSRSSRSSA